MPIVQADLNKYASANMPTNDTSASGGAIATTWTMDEMVLAANDTLEALSNEAGDVRDVFIWGRDATGAIVTETITLSGTTAQQAGTPKTFERILRVQLQAAAVPTSHATRAVTLRRSSGGATVCIVGANRHTNTMPFYDAASNPSATRVRFEKEYWRNDHATLTLTAPAIQLTADPSSHIFIGLESGADDQEANRLTVPGGVTFVDDGVDVNPSNLAAGGSVGVWIRQSLGIAEAPFKSTYTTQLTGTSA